MEERAEEAKKVHTIGHLPARKEYHVDGQGFPVFPGAFCVPLVERAGRIRSFASKWEKVKKPVSWQVSVSWAKERKRRRSGRGMYRYIFLFLTRGLSVPCVPCVSRFPIVQTSPIRVLSLGLFSIPTSFLVVGTSTTVPGSTTRTNIELETAIRRPEYGHGSPRTSSRARNACVAFKPAPKLPSLLSLSLSPIHFSAPTLHTRSTVLTFQPCVQFQILRNEKFLFPSPDLRTDFSSSRDSMSKRFVCARKKVYTFEAISLNDIAAKRFSRSEEE